MKVETSLLELDGTGGNGIVDITPQILGIIARTGLHHGQMVLFCTDGTGTVTTMAADPGAAEDLRRALEKLAQSVDACAHGGKAANGNAAVKASLLKPGLTLPIVQGKPTLDYGQRIVFVAFATGSRRHSVVFQVIGDTQQVRDPAIDLG